ncbi:MAG: putative nucleotidyltransferase with HDIG domain [Myxococcota bacterium]
MSLLDDLKLTRNGGRRLAVLVLVSLGVAALSVDWATAPSVDVQIGDVASRTITAPYDFHYQDTQARRRDQESARAEVLPVVLFDEDLAERLDERIQTAFSAARQALPVDVDPDTGEAPERDLEPAIDTFRERLSRHLPSGTLLPLAEAGFPDDAARLTRELLSSAMGGYIVGDRFGALDGVARVSLSARDDVERVERAVVDVSDLREPSDARQSVSMALMEARVDAPWTEAAATVARALIQSNVEYNQKETLDRQERAVAEIPVRTVTVQQGTTLFRKGDPITPLHRLQYVEMQKSHTGRGRFAEFTGLFLIIGFLSSAVFAFGASSVHNFSTRVRDVASGGLLLLVVAAFSAGVDWIAPSVAQLLGAGATAESLLWVVPVAGVAMLVRLLIGVPWALAFNAAASATVVLVTGGGILEFTYFMASSTVAAGAVHHTRERMAILRAGLFTGTVNAVMACVLFYLLRSMADDGAGDAQLGALFAMLAAFVGGVGSSFVVLGLTPVFEALGFVTDYRLMELANLNHPLMRQLMLRAPGSYHHSVVVGSLAEAGCEAIGANALLARVASYFHDIGKSLKPQYFVENQGDSGNRHDALDAQTSAEVIIDHVLEGGRMAREHNLPKPVLDNIYMHHGTGLLSYFYGQARANAEDPDSIEEARFRYPGPKPNTREAGVIMLADKIEAATRTIAQPNEDNIREMIKRIVDSVMADGQFSGCPLTMAEISIVLDTFVKTLLGIYHHRIEYADTADVSNSDSGGVVSRVIPMPTHADLEDDANTDYESVEHLPH